MIDEQLGAVINNINRSIVTLQVTLDELKTALCTVSEEYVKRCTAKWCKKRKVTKADIFSSDEYVRQAGKETSISEYLLWCDTCTPRRLYFEWNQHIYPFSGPQVRWHEVVPDVNYRYVPLPKSCK